MGNKPTKPQQILKINKAVDDEKLLKIGLGLGKGSMKIEGNFQMGWTRKCDKRYKPCARLSLVKEEKEEPPPIEGEKDNDDNE